MAYKFEEHPYRITEVDPNVAFVAPTSVVPGEEFDIWEFTAPILTSYLFEEGMQVFAEIRTTETGNPEIPATTTVKLVKTDPNRFSRIEVLVAPYAQWKELIDALKKLYQGEDWKLESQFKLVISYVPLASTHVVSRPHSRFLLETIRVAPVLTL